MSYGRSLNKIPLNYQSGIYNVIDKGVYIPPPPVTNYYFRICAEDNKIISTENNIRLITENSSNVPEEL